jgi:hypothetical protein
MWKRELGGGCTIGGLMAKEKKAGQAEGGGSDPNITLHDVSL